MTRTPLYIARRDELERRRNRKPDRIAWAAILYLIALAAFMFAVGFIAGRASVRPASHTPGAVEAFGFGEESQ